MGQLKISGMFAKRPVNLLSSQPASETGITKSSSFQRKEVEPVVQTIARSQPRASNSEPYSSVSIPMTPQSATRPSTGKRRRAAKKHEEQIVPETPRGVTTGQTAPSVPASTPRSGSRRLAAKGDSPLNTIDISSGIDSDCEITMVQPSPKKQRTTNQEASPPSRRNLSKKSKRKRNNRSRSARKAKKMSKEPKAPQGQQQLAKTSQDDSECFIEKVLPSPKKRVSNSQQHAEPAKKRRLEDTDSIEEDVAKPIPFALSRNFKTNQHVIANGAKIGSIPISKEGVVVDVMTISSDSDADDELSELDTPCKKPKYGTSDLSKPASKPSLLGRSAFIKLDQAPAKVPSHSSSAPTLLTSQFNCNMEIEIPDSEDFSDDGLETQGTSIVQLGPVPGSKIMKNEGSSPRNSTTSTDLSAGLIKTEPSPETSEDEALEELSDITTSDEDKLVRRQLESESPFIKCERRSDFSSSPLRYWSQNSIGSSPPVLPGQSLTESASCLVTPPTSSLTSILDEDSSAGETDVKPVIKGSETSSPIAYYDTSDDEVHNIKHEQVTNAKTSLMPNEPGFPSAFESESETESESAAESGWHAPLLPPGFASSIPSKDEDSDDSVCGNSQTPPTSYHGNSVPFDVYNMPRVGAGGYEPTMPPSDRQPYVLQPVYDGFILQDLHRAGQSGKFKPHHRHELIGLKSILKEQAPEVEDASDESSSENDNAADNGPVSPALSSSTASISSASSGSTSSAVISESVASVSPIAKETGTPETASKISPNNKVVNNKRSWTRTTPAPKPTTTRTTMATNNVPRASILNPLPTLNIAGLERLRRANWPRLFTAKKEPLLTDD